ncbi:MAG: hypothetical protein LAT65_05080 [Saccharospirillum sp.]|nr:hypothetical protein [Saccharospirillum sp.]
MIARNAAYLLLYGLATLLSTGRFSLAIAAWLAPIMGLLFLYSNHQKASVRLRWLFLASWVALSIAWYGATPIWGLAHLVFMAFNAAVGVCVYILVWWLWQPKVRGFLWTLVFPAVYVSVETLSISGSPFGSFGADAYSQVNFLPFVQLTSITGLLGISFLMTWTASTLVWCFIKGRARSLRHPGPWSMAALLVAVIGWGGWQLQQPVGASTVRIAGVTAQSVDMHQYMNWFESDPARFDEQSRALHRLYLESSEEMVADTGAQLVVWPELAGLGTFDSVEQLLADASELAARLGVYLLVPSLSLDTDGERVALNQAHLIDAGGTTLLQHVKFGGNFIEGTQPGPVQVSWVDSSLGRIGVLICWDADFPDVVREAGRMDLDFLIVVAKDWAGIDPLHGEMAIFRAMENRVSLFRQADSGLSVATDPYGRVLDKAQGAEHRLFVDLPTPQSTALYPRLGNLLGTLCLAAVLLLSAAKGGQSLRRRHWQ